MGLIGSVLGGAASAVGGIMAGNALDAAYKQQQKLYDQRMSEVKAHRDAVYYQDPNASAGNVAAVTNAQKVLAEQGKRSRATNAVTGGTAESEALAKQQATDAVGSIIQQQATQHEAQKENVYQNADKTLDAFTQYKANAILGAGQAKAQATQQAFSGLAQTAGSLDFGGKVGKTGMSW